MRHLLIKIIGYEFVVAPLLLLDFKPINEMLKAQENRVFGNTCPQIWYDGKWLPHLFFQCSIGNRLHLVVFFFFFFKYHVQIL